MTAAPAEVARRLAVIEDRIARACATAGRSRSEVTLVGASKVHGVETLRAAYDAGLRTFGENRVQELAAKAEQMPADVDWHLIGPLQSNKVRKAVSACSTVQSVDRLKIARAIDRVCGELGIERRGLIEVNLGDEPSKHGFAAGAVPAALAELEGATALAIAGLMAIPPQTADPEEARPWFRELRRLRDRVAERPPPGWRGWLSMGMSGDFEVAIEEGATHVRIGTALFGPRAAAGAG